MTDRMNELLARYGEICNQQTAARILNVSDRTIARMLKDGRLSRLGHRVDVRSIAEYIENPEAHNYAARYEKKHGVVPVAASFDFLAASKRRGL